MVTKIHGENDGNEAITWQKIALFGLLTCGRASVSSTQFFCFPDFYWCHSSGLTSKRALNSIYIFAAV